MTYPMNEYQRTQWVNGQAPALSAENLNHIEEGIKAVTDEVISLEEKSSNKWKDKKYISHGDSITWYDGHGYLWGEHKGEIATGYQTIMKELLGLSYNRATDNKGRSGYTIAHNYEGSHDGSDNLVDVIADVNIDYTAYDLCTILGGTNDYRRATPLGELGQTGDDYESLDTDTFYGAYRKCVEYILTAAPDIRLVLITPFQRDPYSAWSSYEATYDGNKPNAEGLNLIDYVNAVKLIGKMYGLPVCDLYSNSGITELTLSTYTIDGLHPNDEGFKRIGEVLADTLTTGGNNDATDLSEYAKKSDLDDFLTEDDVYTIDEADESFAKLTPIDPVPQVISSLPVGQTYSDTTNRKAVIKTGAATTQEFYDTTYIDSMIGDIGTALDTLNGNLAEV